jgi:hypothetical protein
MTGLDFRHGLSHAKLHPLEVLLHVNLAEVDAKIPALRAEGAQARRHDAVGRSDAQLAV